jgi:TonB-linked SusC/RagA family outer membrane protein
MRQNLLFLLMLFLCSIGQVSAQNRDIAGKITDAKTGEELPGVSVFVKGTTIGSISDAQGNYRISIPTGSTVVFQGLGFKSIELIPGVESALNIQLESDTKQLNEVVVLGYSSVEKREITGAVSQIKGDEIQNLPIQSFDRALQGRAAGVQVQSANGVPGGAVSVRIRGVGSITAGNEPLYIVDGVQMNNRNDGRGTVSNNPLSFLNPNDIESIDVLKDAANAAIYGSQAANGVVIITTKRGKAGTKTNFTFNYYKGIVEPIGFLNVMNSQQYIQARAEAYRNSQPATYPTIESAIVKAATELGFPADVNVAGITTYDWQKEVYKQGVIDNYELTASGGNDKTTFYASAAYNQQDASLINIDYKKISGRVNLEHKISTKFKFELGLNISSILQRGPYGSADGTTAFGAPQYAAPLIIPTNPIYHPDGSFYGLTGTGGAIIGDLNQNIVANSTYIKSKGGTNQLVGNFALNYEIIKGLLFRGTFGLDYRQIRTEFYGDPRLRDYEGRKGLGIVNIDFNKNFITNYTLNYTKTFAEKHNLNALVGFEYREEVFDGNGTSAENFPSPDFNTINAGAIPLGSSGFWTSFKRVGVFTNIRYDLSKKYLATFTLRYDGSSRFGTNSKYGWFPSASVGWNLHEENFIKNLNLLDELRLRVSWGTTGNDQIGNFDARSLYGLIGTYNGSAGVGPTILGNPDLRWEKNVTTNVGLDVMVLNGRVKAAVDMYRRVSQDLLLARSLPGVNGFTSIVENVGEVVNKGLEIGINTINVDVKNFKWESDFNIAFVDNEVTKLFDGTDVLPGNLSIRVGYPIGTNVGIPFVGVNPANGRPMWHDINGNITYVSNRAIDQRPLGHKNLTTVYGGLTNTFTYRGIELSAFFQYDYGRTALNSQELRLADLGGAQRNGLVYYFDERWTTPGQVTSVPAPAIDRSQNTSRISSYQSAGRFYQDASYIRLKQLTLAYNLPLSWLKGIKLAGVKVYAQAINLITWTNWTGFDPEFADTAGTGLSNQGVIPQSKNYTFGVQVGF